MGKPFDPRAAIAAHIEEHGVTRCPPGVAMGVTDLEGKLGVAATELYGQLADKQKRAQRNTPGKYWDLGRCAAFEARWRAGESDERIMAAFALSSPDAVRYRANALGLHAVDRGRPATEGGA